MKLRFPLMSVAAVVIAALISSAPAHADLITYTTIGTFLGGDAPGTNIYLDASKGIDIVFNGIVTNSVNASPTTLASFGSFETSATSATTSTAVTSSFTLQIFQTTPVPAGPLTFIGTLSGTLSISSSGAFLTFADPTTQSLGNISYLILNPVLGLVPPTTNSGVSTLQGVITAPVPEPTSLALSGLGTFALLLCRSRIRKGRAVA